MQDSTLTPRALMDLLPGNVRQAMINAGTIMKYGDGQFIHGRGDEKPGLSVILDGAINVGSLTRDGTPIPTTLLTKGHCFGEVTCFGDLPRTHDAVAAGPATVLQLSHAWVQSAFANDPQFSLAFMQMMTSRLYNVLDRLEDFRRYPPLVILAKLILERAGNGNRIKIVQTDLAYTIGVSRVTVGSLLSRLEAQNLVQRGYASLSVDTGRLSRWVASQTSAEVRRPA